MATLRKVTHREKLKPRRDPYFESLATGCALGFRKMSAATEGTWVARWRDPATGKQHHKPLGSFDELTPSDRYDAAKRAADAWFRHLGMGGSTDAFTVADACNEYVANLARDKRHKVADETQRRFERYVLGDRIATLPLEKLAPRHLRKRRQALEDLPTPSGRPRAAATLNRDLVCLKAALNHAVRMGYIGTDYAWRETLTPIKNANQRRDVYLDRAQRKRLIAAAAPDLAEFIRVLCLLPLRPGAVAALTVADYDRRLKTLTIRVDKAGAGRKFKLPPAAARLFTTASKDKLPGAHLFTRADGVPWNKDNWKLPMRAAMSSAGLPDKATAYSLRHSTITDLVTAGTDLATVAAIAGTSVLMIQRNYHHLQQDVAANALANLAL